MSATARRSDGDLPKGLDVDGFLSWVKDRPGRYELHDGYVIAMAPERVRHASTKFAVQAELAGAIRKAGLQCHMVPDGVGVRVSDRKWYQPDALVYCGAKAPDDDQFIASPVVVVEVSSPTTSSIDEQQKLVGYFSLPSVQHYLIIYAESPVVHHRRQSDGTILTKLVSTGALQLDPPGIEVDVAAVLA